MTKHLGSRLFAPYGIDRFVNEHWRPHRPFLMHGSLGRVADVAALSQANSVAGLLAARPQKLKAWMTRGTKFTAVRDLSQAQAQKLWETQLFTIVADDMDQELPVIRELLESTATGLGYTTDCDLQANIYCTPPGGGSRAHFDSAEVIVLQVKGRKRWRYCVNQDVQFPLASYFGHYGPMLAKQIHGVLPDEMPDHAHEVTLEPGSVLFLPRGTWHDTRTGEEESVSITLTFVTNTWRSLLSELLEESLVGLPEFREPLPSVRSSQEFLVLVEALVAKTDGATRILKGLHGSFMAARHFGFGWADVYCVGEGLSLRESKGRIELSLASEGRAAMFEVDDALVPLCRWIISTPRWTVEQAAELAKEHAFSVFGFLQTLRKCGAIIKSTLWR